MSRKPPPPWEVLRRLADKLELEGMAGFEGMLVAIVRTRPAPIALMHTMCDHRDCNEPRVAALVHLVTSMVHNWRLGVGSSGSGSINGLVTSEGRAPDKCS